MLHRRLVQLRLVGTSLVAAILSSVVVSSAPVPVAPGNDSVNALMAESEKLSAVQIEWNRGVRDTTWAGSVRLTALTGQMFESGDVVEVTAVGAGSDTCSAMTKMVNRSSAVDLHFSACGIKLWDARGVVVNVSEQASGAVLKSNAVIRRGSLASFDGPVVDDGDDVNLSHHLSKEVGVERLTMLRLSVGGTTADQLVGRQLTSILSTADEVPAVYTGTVGTWLRNQGIWVEKDSKAATPVIVADLSRLIGGGAPTVVNGTQYRMMLLQPQLLGAGQKPANRHALITATGTIDG